MKKSPIPKPKTDYNPSPLIGDKNVLSFEEIFKWLLAREGINYTAVPDGKRNGIQLYSIGLGHQIQPNESDLLTKRLSDAEILEIFKKDIEKNRVEMNKVIKVPLNKNQQLALISLRYNIGPSAFANSTLLKILNTGNYTGAALRFAEWRLFEGKINQGLVNRRELERALFSKPV